MFVSCMANRRVEDLGRAILGKGGEWEMGKVHQFNGWQAVKESALWHYFNMGVSLCGRFEETRIMRSPPRNRQRMTCTNCEKSRKSRGLE